MWCRIKGFVASQERALVAHDTEKAALAKATGNVDQGRISIKEGASGSTGLSKGKK